MAGYTDQTYHRKVSWAANNNLRMQMHSKGQHNHGQYYTTVNLAQVCNYHGMDTVLIPPPPPAPSLCDDIDDDQDDECDNNLDSGESKDQSEDYLASSIYPLRGFRDEDNLVIEAYLNNDWEDMPSVLHQSSHCLLMTSTPGYKDENSLPTYRGESEYDRYSSFEQVESDNKSSYHLPLMSNDQPDEIATTVKHKRIRIRCRLRAPQVKQESINDDNDDDDDNDEERETENKEALERSEQNEIIIPPNAEAITTQNSESRAMNACVNCHQRKTKCSQQRPSCNNCKRKQLDCEYPIVVRRRGKARNNTKRHKIKVECTSEPPSQSPLPLRQYTPEIKIEPLSPEETYSPQARAVKQEID